MLEHIFEWCFALGMWSLAAGVVWRDFRITPAKLKWWLWEIEHPLIRPTIDAPKMPALSAPVYPPPLPVEIGLWPGNRAFLASNAFSQANAANLPNANAGLQQNVSGLGVYQQLLNAQDNDRGYL